MIIQLSDFEKKQINEFLSFKQNQIKQLEKDIELTENKDLRTLLIRQRDQTLGSLQGFDKAMSILSINYYN